MSKTIVFLRSNPINPDSRVEKEMNSLNKRGYKTIALCWDRESNYKEKEFEVKLPNTSVTIIRRGIKASFGDGIKNIIPFIKFQFFLFKWLVFNKNKYDIIHACDFDTGFVANVTRVFTKKKMVFDVFDYLSTDANTGIKKIIKVLENNVINKSNATIICTEQRIEQIRGTSPNKLVVIHNTPHINFNCKPKQHDKTKVVYVGILQEHRLILEMLEVISRHPEIEMHIGGFGKLEKEIISLTKTYSNIIFYGKLSYSETLELESQCDIMTAIYQPDIGNHFYAAPNKFYEGLMLGKPLIMVKNTGMSNIVLENNIGICIDYNSQSFEEGLERLILRKGDWPKMGSRMQELYKNDYSWGVMETRLIQLYEELFEEVEV